MGVTGLWRLIEPAGKPVPVETLENKVLAVDISIWLHQMVKGYQDAKGAPLPNAHLIGLFQRLCKLLYFRIKPVFVFDGAYPELKKETIAKRQHDKAKYNSVSERLKRELALLSVKKTAIHTLLDKVSPTKGNVPDTSNDDIFKLPALPHKDGSESESEEESSTSSIADLHSVDIESDKFKNLPTKEKYDLLLELKETRKMNSWGRLHELPKKSDNFSDFQMQRLLKRRKVQECLEDTEKEMGDGGMSLNDLESLLNETGIDTKIESNIPTKRIAANNNTRFILINNVKQALADARKRKLAEINKSTSKQANEDKEFKTEEEDIKSITEGKVDEDLEMAIKMSMECIEEPNTNFMNIKPELSESKKKDELEDDLERAIKMSLECVEDPSTSASVSKTDDSWISYTDNESTYTDSEEDEGSMPPDMSSAKAYIMQYSDFSHKAINDLVTGKGKRNKKSKGVNVNRIIDEMNKEASVIVDRVDLLSDDEVVEVADLQKSYNTDQSVDELELDTSSENFPTKNADINTTQASVICIENIIKDVVEIDSSLEESNQVENFEVTKKESASDSDSEFEDVPEIETKPKTVVQLILNTDDISGDDIFADIFIDRKKNYRHEKDVVSDTISEKEHNTSPSVKVQTGNIKLDISETNKPKKDNFSENILLNSPLRDNNRKSEIQNNPISLENSIQEENLKVISPLLHNSSTLIANISNKELEKEPEVVLIKNTDKTNSTSNKESNTEITVNKIMNIPKEPITTDQLNTMADEIQVEVQDLLQEKGRLDRVGRNITEQMTKEAQELLQIFGIPYIVAPMEAEAQCAFLESIKLTDGTITDDSDIWLFGGRTVYKNFFNQKKHVLQFSADRIEKSFNLSREQLILLALLVGSDYTPGVTGVGPVTALEILASFPFNKKQNSNDSKKQERYFHILDGLQEFKKWVRAGKRTDNTNLKKKLRNVALADDFPSVRVVQAYLDPNVEKSEDKLTWGEVDITVLRDYTKTKFGWSQNKLDEIIKPVLKRLAERKTQKTVHDYFQRKIKFQALDEQMSKRVKAAVQKMGPEAIIEDPNNITEEKTKKPTRKRKTKKQDVIDNDTEAGPSKIKKDEDVLKELGVKVVTQVAGSSIINIEIPKTDRCQEIIPQREKDKQCMLENKLKAIELFRKTRIDRKKKTVKRKVILPKEKAELSESDSD
ncbi:hypothetical protein K1T71_002796 [Dendrolimus kikuchii]|uniref:Uncharacterized protein n=1 Tax=Dendrolimus kikuchii TaxID=765133 RepID=A0ACC1DDM3_9NEOP|nr:hypothetical protein K1T71_002796 [Dendrolimus kikuchii]